MTYEELLKEAKQHISSEIIDCRPAFGFYVEGMDDCEQIPRAIVCWLENCSQIIYINNDKEERGVSMTESEAIKEFQDNIYLPYGVTISDEASKIAIQSIEKYEKIKESFEKWKTETVGYYGADDETTRFISTLSQILRSDEE